MSPLTLLFVALGGAAGSVARAVVSYLVPSRFPWGTLLINVVGSLLIGVFLSRWGADETVDAARWRALLAVGFCGGFTTFSTFSWQTLAQMQRGEWLAALANVFLSVTLCLAATWLGWRLSRA